MNNVLEIKCRDCGETIIFSKQAFPGHPVPSLCLSCRRKRRDLREAKEAAFQHKQKEAQKKADAQAFENEIKKYAVVDVDNIDTTDDATLIVLGNGFDLMHGVKSSYYSFRDSMGKHNDLRRTLEEYLDVDDVWWSFEYALSRIDVKRMANSAAVKTSLDFFDGFHPEESAAGYFAAIDGAADPMYIICSELPRSFRRWVNSLKWGTDNLPLKKMIHQPYVLCFNYTEFIESEYGVSHDKVCYIHGCRQNKNQPLILGHLEGDSDDMYNFEDDYSLGQKNPLVQLAQENIVEKITYYDQSLTKHCDEIISRNGEFFDKLENIENIIIIGHSLADVDRDYFREIVRNNIDCQKLNWFFGCYGIGDLRQISSFIEDLKIPKENIYIFRTDSLNIPFRKTKEQSIKRAPKKSGRILCRLADEQWTVKTDGNRLSIMNSDGDAVLSHLFIQPPRRAFFDEIGQFLIVILNGQTSGIYVYHKFDTTWKLIDELPSTGQSIINSRLRKVFLEQQCLTFVYNNRVKSYNLSTCKLINNEGLMGAKDKTFSGTEITRYFKN